MTTFELPKYHVKQWIIITNQDNDNAPTIAQITGARYHDDGSWYYQYFIKDTVADIEDVVKENDVLGYYNNDNSWNRTSSSSRPGGNPRASKPRRPQINFQ